MSACFYWLLADCRARQPYHAVLCVFLSNAIENRVSPKIKVSSLLNFVPNASLIKFGGSTFTIAKHDIDNY